MTSSMTAVLLLAALCSTTGLAIVTGPSRIAAVRASQPRLAQPAHMSQKPRSTKESVDVSQAAASISAEIGAVAEPPATAGKGAAAGTAASYRRSSDLMNNGDKVSARQVVNALGRWSSRREWNDAGIGRKVGP